MSSAASNVVLLMVACLLIIATLFTNVQQCYAKTTANDYITRVVRPEELHELKDYFVDYAQPNGYVFIDAGHQAQTDPANLSNHFTVTAPYTFLPSPFPKELFELAWNVQKTMAKVHLRVSLNYKFIKDAMADVAESDPTFIGEMVNIMDAVKDNHRRQSGMTLLLQRSDYLSHVEPAHNGQTATISIKQIEVSTGIHGGQGQNPHKLHQRIVDKIIYTRKGKGEPVPALLEHMHIASDDSVQGQAFAFYETWLEFTKIHGDKKAIILLISPAKRSAHTHFQERKWVQFKLEDIARERGEGCPHVELITFKECPERLKFAHNHIFLDGQRRVAIVFHGGYLPTHFSGRDDWKIRLKMEQSQAVVVPNVFTFLAGTKKIQQVLAEDGQLERLFPEIEEAEKNHKASADAKAEAMKLREELAKLRGTFTQMWGLGKDTQEERDLIEQAIASPDDFVLKENLEGGKGNYFGEELVKKLESLKDSKPLEEPLEESLEEPLKDQEQHKKRSIFILQKKIRPFAVKNAFAPVPPATADVSADEPVRFVDVNSELSIFGALLAKSSGAEGSSGKHHQRHKQNVIDQQQKIVFNNVDGYFVRTKITSNHMCNICGGQGGMDSLVLFPQKDFLPAIENTGGSGKAEEIAPEQLSIDELPDEI